MKKQVKNLYGHITPKMPRWKRTTKDLLFKLHIIPKSTAVLPRKGIIGDWENYFDEDSKLYFKKVAGELTIKLGYEHSNNW